MESFLVIWVPIALVCGFLGAVVGSSKGAAGEGLLLGALFGPLGVVVAFALDQRKSCGQCGTRLNGSPSVCPSCGAAVTASDPAAGLQFSDNASEAAEAEYVRKIRAKREGRR